MGSEMCIRDSSDVHVIDTATGEEVDVEFTDDDPARASLLEKAEALVDEWAMAAWNLRERVVYKLSPTLTKSVAKVPVGVNARGYDLVHNVLDQQFPFSMASLNSLFEHAIGVELEYDEAEMEQMKDATRAPGMRAAGWAQTVAAACSTAVCFLVAYRADGRTVMNASGSAFEPTESWLRTAMRTPLEANDCDGSALLVVSMLQTAVDASDADLEALPYVRAVKHAVFPYYTYGVAVVAASGAEASGGGGGEHVAGHALALLVPTLGFLAALDRP